MISTSRWAFAALAVASIAGFGSAANAGAIPYPNAGTPIAAPSYNFTASSTGGITAYFYTSDAADDEQVSMLVNGLPTDIFGLDNHTSVVGEAFNLGAVEAGDKIEFFISDFSTGVNWYSNAADNLDALNHAYATVYTGGVSGIPVGTYVGFEDRGTGGDYDYNDDQFVFTNVASSVASGTPEPSTWAMILLGFAGLGFAGWRAQRKTAALAA
jgi:PEP-CTERM motif